MATSSLPASLDQKLNAELLARAYRKLMDKQELTKEEKRSLSRHEREKEERLRWQYYRSIPQKHWREMSGRQSKVINEQAQRYGIPFGGKSINLPDAVRYLHDFLADNALKLAREEDFLMQGAGSPALEEYRQERAKMARMERRKMERSLLPRSEVREALGRIAALLRTAAGDTLRQECGDKATAILAEVLDDAKREMERFFAAGSEEENTDPRDEVQPSHD